VSVNINNDIKPSDQTVLSVQQLLDCDTNSINNGCEGGNPQLAFEYIIQNGITSWDLYPFDGGNEKCLASATPVAGILSYVALPPNNEGSILNAMGQAAVTIGVCADDYEFMYYSSGVFDYKKCCTAINHAVLIVGYGYDDKTNQDYWVVQNSWGATWGENGFIRMLRNTNHPGSSPGMCGLALSASYPLGGYIISNGQISLWDIVQSYWDAFVLYVTYNWTSILYYLGFVSILSVVILIIYEFFYSFFFNTRPGEYEEIYDTGDIECTATAAAAAAAAAAVCCDYEEEVY